MKYVGAHVSASGGVQNAPLNAEAIGAKAFALFTKSQRQWNAKPLTEKNITSFKENLKKVGIKPKHVLPHDGYLINLGNASEEKRERSLKSFIDEAKRVEQLGLIYLNFHPGSHLKEISEEESLTLVAQGINSAIKETENTVFVIENTAGQGTNLGYCFEHLAYIIDLVENKDRVGVCIDTCHTYASGYDIATKPAYEKVMKEFDKLVGMHYLKGMHLNDCKSDFGSRVDRHHSIGKGTLGTDVFKFIMNDKRMNNIPLILETIEPGIWEQEIKMLYSFVKK